MEESLKKKLPKETPEEQFEVVQRLKKRHPEWQFDICPVCGEWGKLWDGYNGIHPMCYEQHPTKRKKVKNRNQQNLF